MASLLYQLQINSGSESVGTKRITAMNRIKASLKVQPVVYHLLQRWRLWPALLGARVKRLVIVAPGSGLEGCTEATCSPRLEWEEGGGAVEETKGRRDQVSNQEGIWVEERNEVDYVDQRLMNQGGEKYILNTDLHFLQSRSKWAWASLMLHALPFSWGSRQSWLVFQWRSLWGVKQHAWGQYGCGRSERVIFVRSHWVWDALWIFLHHRLCLTGSYGFNLYINLTEAHGWNFFTMGRIHSISLPHLDFHTLV